jgi:hypothetical protein
MYRACRMTVVTFAGLCVALATGYEARATAPQASESIRATLSEGYSLLYQEADGIPKLDWLLKLKDKPEALARILDPLVNYYRQLAADLERLSKQYPALRIDAKPMSDIEAETRKAIGSDLAKDIAPLVGKSGVPLEREVLLTFYESLNEQRHLVRVMADRETDSGLKQFLTTTETQLDTWHAKVATALNRCCFTH